MTPSLIETPLFEIKALRVSEDPKTFGSVTQVY